eukprot:9301881-Prorocentrum_lima.AAC.1
MTTIRNTFTDIFIASICCVSDNHHMNGGNKIIVEHAWFRPCAISQHAVGDLQVSVMWLVR